MSEAKVRGFPAMLAMLEDGQLIADMSARLVALNAQMSRIADAQGKAKAEIILKIKLSTDSGGTVQIDGDFAVKEPKLVRARTVMWLTKDNHLAPENPKQQKLPLREVPRANADVREIDSEKETRNV